MKVKHALIRIDTLKELLLNKSDDNCDWYPYLEEYEKLKKQICVTSLVNTYNDTKSFFTYLSHLEIVTDLYTHEPERYENSYQNLKQIQEIFYESELLNIDPEMF